MKTLWQACQVQAAVFILDRYINIIIMKQFKNVMKSCCTNKKLRVSFKLKGTLVCFLQIMRRVTTQQTAYCRLWMVSLWVAYFAVFVKIGMGLKITAVLHSRLLSSLLGQLQYSPSSNHLRYYSALGILLQCHPLATLHQNRQLHAEPKELFGPQGNSCAHLVQA